MTSNESERISLRAAINERAERLRRLDDSDLEHPYARDALKDQIADLRAQLLENLDAALAERAERLRTCKGATLAAKLAEVHALKAQIRALETEKHALLQELPL